VSEELLRFDPEAMPAAQAVRRVQARVPELKQKAKAQAEANKASMLRAIREAEAMCEEAEAASDSEGSEGADRSGIEKKLNQLGELPPGAHPDLQIVLDLQRNEIRTMVQRIKDAERDLQVKKHALEYVEGRPSMNTEDQELMSAVINAAQEMKASIYLRQKEEAERKMRQEQIQMNVPTEQEVEEQVAESERLAHEVNRVAEQVKKLQEMTAAAVQAAEEDIGAHSGTEEELEEDSKQHQEDDADDEEGAKSKRGDKVSQIMSVQKGTDGSPKVFVDLSRVAEVHRELSQEAAKLEEKTAAEDKRIAQAEGVMRNAEQTLRVLEEAKALLLEYVAREKPALIEGLLPPPDEPEEVEDELDQAGSSTPSSEDEVEDEEEAVEHLKSLHAEEQRLRSQLAEAEKVGLESHAEAAAEQEEEGSSAADDEAAPQAAARKDPAKRCTRGLLRLARRLTEAPEDDDEADGGSSSSSADAGPGRGETPLEGLTRDEAILQLRSMPHEELKALLRLRNDNQRLAKQVAEARAELERLRLKHGDPKALLGDGDAEAAQEQGVPPELVLEVKRKVRELRALRRRWWRDRQDESNTVRRTLAAAQLPEDGADEDRPPKPSEESLFRRVQASMTLP